MLLMLEEKPGEDKFGYFFINVLVNPLHTCSLHQCGIEGLVGCCHQ